MLIIALVVLALLGWYFGRRVYQIFTFRGLAPSRPIFWLVLLGLMVAVLATRSVFVTTLITGILCFALGDLLFFILRSAGAESALRALQAIWQGGLLAVVIALLATGWAGYNARHPVVTSYSIGLDKSFGQLDGINIVMLADTHLGTVVNAEDLPALVAKVNSQSPDIICLCGDIFEEGTSEALRRQAIESFGGFKATYGTYYITGNHDSALLPGEAERMADSGVTVLGDRAVLIADSFYLVGRWDGGHQGDLPRAPIDALLEDVDRSRPIILLDHRPGDYQAAARAGADLQLSGHTHAGQFWPFGLLSGLSNGVNYGHKTVEDMSIVVTSGYGVWGFPARTAQRCELVSIRLTGLS